MALYLGSSEKLKINLNGVVHYLNLFSENPITNGIRLLSSDGYILKDLNGIYLIPSDYIGSIVDSIALSLDNYILKDSNGLYLTIKESE